MLPLNHFDPEVNSQGLYLVIQDLAGELKTSCLHFTALKDRGISLI